MTSQVQHNLVRGTQRASFWLDESGSRNTARDCFVVAGFKVRQADVFQRELTSVREKYQEHTHELKFGRVTDRSLPVFLDVIDLLAASKVRLVAAVVDGQIFNPFSVTSEPWRAHAYVASRLIHGNINRNEVVNVAMDGLTTPPGVSLGQQVMREVNRSIGATAVVDAVTYNSKSSDLLQVADLVAGAVFYDRRRPAGNTDPNKAKIAQRLAWSFDQRDLSTDVRHGRVSILSVPAPTNPSRSVLTPKRTSAPVKDRGARR